MGLKGGLGRGFISRGLLDATDWGDAISLITVNGQCAGHNYQLMDMQHRRIANIETAPGQFFSFKHISSPFFHTNQYLSLKVPETFGNSSVHRLRRAAQLPLPKDAAGVLSVLGDQQDRLWPVFHDEVSHARGELSDWTVATALFDLDKRTMTMFHGNPQLQQVMYQMQILPSEAEQHAAA